MPVNSKFLKDLSTVPNPLYRLLKNRQAWTRGKDQEDAFRAGKEMLKSSRVIAHFDETAPVILSCDASPYGGGCVLSITGKLRGECPVAFYSRSLFETEQRYSQTDREGLSVIARVRRFHYYMAGRQVTIRTDHKPLLGILGDNNRFPTMASPQVTRWALLLSGYQ